MTISSQKELFEEIELLPLDIKAKLADKILRSLNSINSETDKLWIQEVLKRKEEIENGSVKLLKGEEVFNKIKQKFNQQ